MYINPTVIRPPTWVGGIVRAVNRFAALPELKIKRTGTVDQVAAHLRAMIADGRLSQGERLPEIPLSEALGGEHARGAVVRTLSSRDVADIYDVRRMLELRALAAAHCASTSLTRARNCGGAVGAAALDRGDYTSFVEHELEFHGALVGLLDSERLDRFFGNVLGELRLLFSELSSDSEPRTSRTILSVYRRVFRAAEKGDYEKAAQLLGTHLDTYERRLRASLAGADTPAAPPAP